jgi:hypothetical protein
MAFGQRWQKNRYEVVYSLGATNFLGELGGADRIGTNGLRDLEFPATRPVIGLGYRYKFSRTTAVKGNLFFGYVGGNDNLTKDIARNNRNLNFRSPVLELSGQFEYMLIKERPGHRYNLRGVRGWRNIGIEAYVFGGLGGFFFNPRGKYNGLWYSLKPLCTEGEGLVPSRKKYSKVQLCIPFGIGFKYKISKNLYIGLEYGIRKTFTDYIDDVSTTYFDPNALFDNKGILATQLANPTNNSADNPKMTLPGQQRGDPRDKDAYMFAVITVYYKLKKGISLPKF